MKYIFALLLAVIVIIPTKAELINQDSSGILIDKIISSVGGELILWSEVEEQVAMLKERQQGIGEKTDCAILQNLLIQKLLLNQARMDSIIIGDAELESQLEARVNQVLGMMNNDIEFFEEYYGMSIDEVKSEFKRDLEEKLLIERMQGRIVNNVKMTPAEVKYFFNQIHKDSLPYFNSEVEYRELVFLPEANDESRKSVVELLKSIRDKIKEGEEFGEFAKIYSEDPGSGASGGDLGWQTRGTFVPEFEAAVFNLEPNELSPIVKTQFGYHLIQLVERRGNDIHAKHILISPDVLSEDIDKMLAFADSIKMQIVKDSMSFEYAVKRYSHEKEMSATNGGRVVNPASGNTFFEIDQLEPDIYFTLDSLIMEDLSSAFVDRNARGEKVVRVIQLISRTDPHQANLGLDYSKIAKAAQEQKKSKALNDWMLERVATTFIKIDERYLECDNISDWFSEN